MEFGFLEIEHLLADEVVHELDFFRVTVLFSDGVLEDYLEPDHSEQFVKDGSDVFFIESAFLDYTLSLNMALHTHFGIWVVDSFATFFGGANLRWDTLTKIDIGFLVGTLVQIVLGVAHFDAQYLMQRRVDQ